MSVAPFDPDEIGRDYGEEPPADALATAEPVFSADHGIYTYRLGAPAFVALELDQVRSARDGDLTAEVTARSTAPGRERVIHLARCTITGTRSRQDLATHLAKRHPGPSIDWSDVVEQATVQTIGAYRAGEPAILLRDAPVPIDAGYLLSPLLVARQPSIWFGDGGNGKSLLALAAALSIHGDRADLLGIHPSSQLRVAYLDWEWDAHEHRQRMRSLLPEGEPEPDLVYLSCYGSLRDQVDRIKRVVREQEVGYLVIDSVAAAAGGEPESAEVALGFFTALRAIGLGSLCIAHTTKNPEAQERPFGSAFWHNSARSTWLVRKEQELGSNGLRVGMFNKKANSGPSSNPLGFAIRFDAGRTTITRTDVRDVPGLAETLPLKPRITHALKAGFRSVPELSDDLGADQDSISKTLRRHEGKGFVRAPMGTDRVQRWGVLAHG